MPKAELHLHLDGSVRVDTALELARTRGVDAPTTWRGMFDALVAPMPCRDQAELLRAFDLPIALMQDAEALERITAELVESKAAEGVRYVEIRWGPLLHVARGLVARRTASTRSSAAPRRAAARTGTVVRLIATALRSHDPADNVRLAEAASRFRDRGLTGWDLAGPEAAFPDPLTPRPTRSRRPARAGCGSPSTPASGAARPRSGARSRSTRSGSPTARRRRTTRRSSPSSRPAACASTCAPPRTSRPASCRRSRSTRSARLHRAGAPVTLSTDDTTVSDVTLTEEYARAVAEIGLTLPELWAIDRFALDVAFADEATLAPLRATFDALGRGDPGALAPRDRRPDAIRYAPRCDGTNP